MTGKEWAILVVLSVLWGGSFFFIELAVAELPPFTIVFLRVTIAACVLWMLVFAKGLPVPKSAKIWLSLLLMGLVNNALPFTLIVWGQTHITSGLASILNATTPLFGVVIAGIFLADEQPTLLKVIGVLLGFAGVVLMVGPSALQSLGEQTLAQFAVLAAALAYACATVYGRRFKTMNISLTVLAAGQIGMAALLLAPLAFFVDRPLNLPIPGVSAIVAVLALAILSTAVAYVLYFRMLASAGATNLMLVTFLIPISSILLGTVILGETLHWIHVVGMGLIALGLSAIDGRLWQTPLN